MEVYHDSALVEKVVIPQEKGDWYVGKHLSFHFTVRNKHLWEFHLLPFLDICDYRILGGWLCFAFQYTYYAFDRLEEY